MFPFEGELNALLLHVTHSIIYLYESGDSTNTFQGPFQLDFTCFLHSQFLLNSVRWHAFPKTCLPYPYSPPGPCVLLHQWACCHSSGTEIQLTVKAGLLFCCWIHLMWKHPAWEQTLNNHTKSNLQSCALLALTPSANMPLAPPRKTHKATWSVKLALSIRIASWQIFTLLPPALTSGSMGTGFPPLRRFTYIKWRGGSSEWTIDGCQARQQGMDVWAWSWQRRPQRVNCFAGTN